MSEVEIFTKRYIKCPGCDKGTFGVEHLFEMNTQSAGPWACDNCNQYFKIKIDGPKIFLEPTKNKRLNTLVLLKLDMDSLQGEPVHFLVQGTTQNKLNRGGDRYYYEEGTCPVNVCRYTQDIIVGDDEDPHGIFEYLHTVETPHRGWEMFTIKDIKEMFPEFLITT